MVEIEKTVDSWFGKIQKMIGTGVSQFVAFFFFSLALGALIGIMLIQHYPDQALLGVIVPALAGAIAYYNRSFATAIFIILILMIFII
jgi:hypothetical protein